MRAASPSRRSDARLALEECTEEVARLSRADLSALVARHVEESEQRSAWRRHAIAAQASGRIREVLAWPGDRPCPPARLREAWVAYRCGLQCVADAGSAAAGPVSQRTAQRLGRAIELYDAYAAQRPAGWPEGGPAALCALASQRRASSLAGDTARLLLLAKAMRAAALERDPVRLARARRRAERRRVSAAVPFAFRRDSPRIETAEQRRRRVRDAVLLGADGEHQGDGTAGNPALWPNAELAVRHIGGLARAVAPRLIGPDNYLELDGIGARAARYRGELARARWQLPSDWPQLLTERRSADHECKPPLPR